MSTHKHKALSAGHYKNQECVMNSYFQKKMGAGIVTFHPYDHTQTTPVSAKDGLGIGTKEI